MPVTAKMKKQIMKTAGAIVGLLLASLAPSEATLAIRLSADNGATWSTVVDGDVTDQNTNNGTVLFNGAVGSWIVNVDTGSSKPYFGSASQPHMELGGVNLSTGPGTLIMQLSDTGFTSAPSARAFANAVGGTTSGTMTFRTYVDKGNVLFGSTATYSDAGALGVSPSLTSAQLLTQGPIGDESRNYPFAAEVSNPSAEAGGAPFSMTLEVVIAHSVGGTAVSSFSDVVDAPEPPPAPCVVNLCGYVIGDANCNGAKDGADKGLANIPVNLFNAMGEAVASASTDTNGAYCFANQPAGSFSVRVSVPNGSTAYQNITNLTGSATNCGANYDNINFYLCPPPCSVTVCGKVVKDTDCDGRHDGTELGMPNFPVILYSSCNLSTCSHTSCTTSGCGHRTCGKSTCGYSVCGKSVSTNYTGVDGTYCFENLKPGNYTVKIVPPSGYKAFCDVKSLTICAPTCGKSYTNSNFYLCPPPVCPPTHWTCNTNWCLETIKLGNNTCSKQHAWTILNASPSCGDKTVTLCQQLIAAKLNRCKLTGTNSIDKDISDCDEFLKRYPFGCNLSGYSSAWSAISPCYQRLVNFNNGCSGPRACTTSHYSNSTYSWYGCDIWGNKWCTDWSSWDRNCKNTWGWNTSGNYGACRWW